MKPPGKATIQQNVKASKRTGTALQEVNRGSTATRPYKISLGDILKKYQFRTTQSIVHYPKQQVNPPTPPPSPSTTPPDKRSVVPVQYESGPMVAKLELSAPERSRTLQVPHMFNPLNNFANSDDSFANSGTGDADAAQRHGSQNAMPSCNPASISHQDDNIFQSAACQLQDQWKRQESRVEQVEKIDLSLPLNIVPVVRNVVSTFSLGCEVNQKEIAKLCFNVAYQPKTFRAVRMAIRNPACKALIFANGKIICAGTKSPDLSKIAARRFARIIMKLGYTKARVKEFRICNMVGTCDLKTRIDLGRLYQSKELKSPGQVGYNQEQFSGLTYPIAGTKLKLMIFHSGKINITGGRSQDEMNYAIRSSYFDIMKYSIKSDD